MTDLSKYFDENGHPNCYIPEDNNPYPLCKNVEEGNRICDKCNLNPNAGRNYSDEE